MAVLALIFGVLEEEHLKWLRLRIKPKDIAWIEKAVNYLDHQPISIGLLGVAA